MAVNLTHIKKVYEWLKNNRIGDARFCPLCHEALPQARMICTTCLNHLPLPTPYVCRCSLPCAATEQGQTCGHCLKHPPHFQESHCAWPYLFPLDRLINRYKHQADLSLEPLLLDIWLQRIDQNSLPHTAALVPIPTHWQRHWRRGFNQADRLAAGLAQALKLPLLPALKQPQRTPMLQGMASAVRKRLIKNRFAVTADVTDLHLILVDDVMTTGSTANEAARALLTHGAKRVDLWTLCRVLPRS